MGDLLLQTEQWKEEQDRKIAAFLDQHDPELAENFRIVTNQERDD